MKERKADNLTNDIYTPTLMSGFMSGDSLRASVGWQGPEDQYQVHNQVRRCNYFYDSLVYGQSFEAASFRQRVSRWAISLKAARTRNLSESKQSHYRHPDAVLAECIKNIHTFFSQSW